jgi:hypothetical protein
MSIKKDSNDYIKANIFNMDSPHAMVEMMLSSLHLDDYTTEDRVLIAANNTIKYRYIKGSHGNTMEVMLLSLEEMELPFVVTFEGKSFATRKIDGRGILDISRLDQSCTKIDII